MTPEITVRLFSNDQFYLDKVFYSNVYKLGNLPEKSVVVDIGAHVGYFALNAIVRGAAKVYCFEPNKYNFRCLLDNTRGVRDAVIPYNFAVLFDNSTLEFEVPVFNGDKYFDFGCINHADPSSDNKEVSPSFTLDSVFSHFIHDKKINLLKVNLGGKYEADLLCSSKYINCVEAVCGITLGDGATQFDKVVAHMNTNGFKNVKLIPTGDESETLFIFSKADVGNMFQI